MCKLVEIIIIIIITLCLFRGYSLALNGLLLQDISLDIKKFLLVEVPTVPFLFCLLEGSCPFCNFLIFSICV